MWSPPGLVHPNVLIAGMRPTAGGRMNKNVAGVADLISLFRWEGLWDCG
jgi:hypothetical protein